MSVEKVHSQRLHRARSVAAQGTRFDEIMLSDVFVLEVCSHRDLSLKPAVANRAVVWQGLCMRCEMFGQVILPEESVGDRIIVRNLKGR